MSVTVQPFGKWQAIVLPYNQGQTDHDRFDRISRNTIISYGCFEPVSPARRLYSRHLPRSDQLCGRGGRRLQPRPCGAAATQDFKCLQLIGECSVVDVNWMRATPCSLTLVSAKSFWKKKSDKEKCQMSSTAYDKALVPKGVPSRFYLPLPLHYAV